MIRFWNVSSMSCKFFINPLVIEKKTPISEGEALSRLHGGFSRSHFHISHRILKFLQNLKTSSKSTFKFTYFNNFYYFNLFFLLEKILLIFL